MVIPVNHLHIFAPGLIHHILVDWDTGNVMHGLPHMMTTMRTMMILKITSSVVPADG